MRRCTADLAAASIARDESAFELLNGGKDRINPLMDLWLRLTGRSGGIAARRSHLEGVGMMPMPFGGAFLQHGSVARLLWRGSSSSDWLIWWMAGAVVVSAVALLISLQNMHRFRRAPEVLDPDDEGWSVTVCIPARNEADNLEACVRSALDSADADPASSTTVMVYDDGSEDFDAGDSHEADQWRRPSGRGRGRTRSRRDGTGSSMPVTEWGVRPRPTGFSSPMRTFDSLKTV